MSIQPQQPAAFQQNPLMPAGPEPLKCEVFEGVNTATTRAGVPDKQVYWMDGFFPLFERNARILPDLGPTLFTRPDSKVIVFFEFYNLQGVPYMIVFLSDGSAMQVNVNTQAQTTVLTAGTITNPSILNVGVSQWGQSYLLIVANQPNGYWIWDGALLYAAGTLAPVVSLTNVGQGYGAAPNIVVTGGHGSGASIAGIIANGFVTSLSVVNPGSGYLAGDSVALGFVGGNTPGSGGTLTAIMTGGAGSGGSVTFSYVNGPVGSLTGAGIAAGGLGYSPFITAVVNFTAQIVIQKAAIVITETAGVLSGVSITNYGNYDNASGAPSAVITDAGDFVVSSVSIVSRGSGYSPSASVSVSGGGGGTISAAAGIGLGISNGSISVVTILSGGAYGTSVAPTLAVVDTAINAAGTVGLMPFGIQGTSIETYQGYVWIVKGVTLYNSAPGAVADFSTSNGGGNKSSTSSKLRIGYTRLIAANGFLYTIADSSIDYVSGVQTAGNPISTTYSWLNADPEAGSPYPEGVMTYGRGLFFCNAFGIQVMYGSQAQKVSEPMDGVYTTVPNFNSMQLSVAEHTVFGRKIALALVPIVDPVSQATVNKLLCWDGKRWFASVQGRSLTYIKHQEINSQITAYGTDGVVVAPLFTTPSNSFIKTIQSRLWDVPGYWMGVAASRFWALLQFFNPNYSSINVAIDNETGSASSQNNTLNQGTAVVWTNNSNVVVIWTNNSAQVVLWLSIPQAPALFASLPEAVGQQGVLIGFTLSTANADMALISAALRPEVDQYRG